MPIGWVMRRLGNNEMSNSVLNGNQVLIYIHINMNQEKKQKDNVKNKQFFQQNQPHPQRHCFSLFFHPLSPAKDSHKQKKTANQTTQTYQITHAQLPQSQTILNIPHLPSQIRNPILRLIKLS
jgi:hypothetical protein